MIESQTELPVQEGGPATSWEKGRQAVANAADRVKTRVHALPGTRAAQVLRGVPPLVDRAIEESHIREYGPRMLGWFRAGVGDGPLWNRFALHLVVVMLAVGVVAVSQVSLPEIDVMLPTPTPAPELGSHTVLGDHAVAAPVTNRGTNRFVSNNAGLFTAPVAHTTIAERDRMEIITYTVQANDNVWSIAQGFGLNAETVLWANPKVEKSPDLLSVGQELVIIPVDGIYYTVGPGDTVDKLAKTYQTTADKIKAFELNNLEEPYTLTPGQKLVIPDGKKKIVVPNYYPMTRVGKAPAGAATGSGSFAWPTQGLLTQRYWSGHLGIDVAARTGTPILAADGGYVVMAGRDTWGYGNQVVIDHGNGFMTRYAHLQTIKVQAGQSVTKNQLIGTMGSTGRSTGPHLHFEVIQNGVRRKPLGYLP
jgi:murein DD-endopeptidase MepM/ murein hydrolase activator NlpD